MYINYTPIHSSFYCVLFSPTLGIVCLFNFSHPCKCVSYLIVINICIFPMVKLLSTSPFYIFSFIYFLGPIWMFLLVKYIFNPLGDFSIELFIYFILIYRILCVVDIGAFSGIWVIHIFSSSCVFPFNCENAFWWTEFLLLVYINIIILGLLLFVFCSFLT